jgi:uncharacterized membrane protein YtjA (UPF0391 family)
MLQGAVVALIVAGLAGALGSTGVNGPGSHDAAWTFLLVGVILFAAYLGTTWVRRWTGSTGVMNDDDVRK